MFPLVSLYKCLGEILDRLRTIISYDRIVVMDAGSVAVSSCLWTAYLVFLPYFLQEFDTPFNLYQNGGLFRGMCERSNITLKDIELAKFAPDNNCAVEN